MWWSNNTCHIFPQTSVAAQVCTIQKINCTYYIRDRPMSSTCSASPTAIWHSEQIVSLCEKDWAKSGVAGVTANFPTWWQWLQTATVTEDAMTFLTWIQLSLNSAFLPCHIHISNGFGIRLLGLAGDTMKFITHGWPNGCHFTTNSTASTQPRLSVLWNFLPATVSTHSGEIINKSGVPMAVRRRGSGPRQHVALLNLRCLFGGIIFRPDHHRASIWKGQMYLYSAMKFLLLLISWTRWQWWTIDASRCENICFLIKHVGQNVRLCCWHYRRGVYDDLWHTLLEIGKYTHSHTHIYIDVVCVSLSIIIVAMGERNKLKKNCGLWRAHSSASGYEQKTTHVAGPNDLNTVGF